MPTVLKASDIISGREKAQAERNSARDSSNDKRAPVDVRSFLFYFIQVFNQAYRKKVDGVAPPLSEIGKSFLIGLYESVCVNGNSFKKQIPREGDVDLEVSSNSQVSEYKLGAGMEIQATDDKVFCYVIRGDGDKGSEGNLNKLMVNPNDSSLSLAVVSYKLLQAVISLMICYFDLQKDLSPSPLSANAVRCCRLPESKPEKENWMVHTHSGLSFVANYIYNTEKYYAEPARMKDPKNPDNRQKFLRNMPSFQNVLIIALKADRLNRKIQLEKGGKIREHALNTSAHPTLDAISRTCGLNKDAMERQSDLCVKLLVHWDEDFEKSATAASSSFYKKITGLSQKNKKGNAEGTSGSADALDETCGYDLD